MNDMLNAWVNEGCHLVSGAKISGAVLPPLCFYVLLNQRLLCSNIVRYNICLSVLVLVQLYCTESRWEAGSWSGSVAWEGERRAGQQSLSMRGRKKERHYSYFLSLSLAQSHTHEGPVLVRNKYTSICAMSSLFMTDLKTQLLNDRNKWTNPISRIVVKTSFTIATSLQLLVG